ncbi:response regulator [Natronolimnohabitans innermongolicus]|uniref:Response regulator receiver protein n=1 Tax=Natronolimnohabitans innermongolicus JCM 12255 TaxID=1227499 RepID=L9WI65_9EURY|nr:response regulator [Natronolimnohabitans innermongolicus]ELY49139.1 response regulator receiver protein [Natronolimnohabitans innermongolicus JCM 12255]
MIDRNEFAEPADVLLVEPSPDAAAWIRDGLTDDRAKTTVHAVSTGDDALAFLERRGEYADAPAPCLVLLRCDLPESGPDGFDVLEAISEEPSIDRVPSIALLETLSDDAVGEAYQRGANAVVPTPTDRAKLVETMELVAQFWIATARLPNRIDRA